MNPTMRFLICLSAGVVLCQCTTKTTTKKKKVDPSEQSLQTRTTSGVDMTKRSQYEKFMNDPKLANSSAGSHFQKQMHHSKSFNGGDSYSGQKQFKTGESIYGRSKSKSFDMTYALGDKQALSKKNGFKTDESRFGSQKAREGDSLFGGADNQFNTGSALTRSKSLGKAPKIIENYNDRGEGKKSAYSEEEVRRLLNRN